MAKDYQHDEVENRVFYITILGTVLFCGAVILFVL